MALRIGNVVVDKPSESVLVLPRDNGEDITIIARAVLSMEEFDLYCPKPQAKKAFVKGKGTIELVDDPEFRKQIASYGEKRFAFMALKSLEPSDIDWQTVKMDRPETWTNWQQELKDAGLGQNEVDRITVCVMQANSLDERKLEEARQAFLHGLEEAAEKSSGPNTEQSTTSSGQPVNDGE